MNKQSLDVDDIPEKYKRIEVHLHDLNMLFDSMDPSPLRSKDLHARVVDHIVDSGRWQRAPTLEHGCQFHGCLLIIRNGFVIMHHMQEIAMTFILINDIYNNIVFSPSHDVVVMPVLSLGQRRCTCYCLVTGRLNK